MFRIFKSKGEKPESEPYFPVNRVNGRTVFRLGRNQDGSDEWSLRYGRLFIAFYENTAGKRRKAGEFAVARRDGFML